MTFVPGRSMFAASALALGICTGAGALANESNAASDAGAGAGAAVAGGGKVVFWSRNNARVTLSGVVVAEPQWAAEVNPDDSRLAFTPEEQHELVQHLRDVLERQVALPAVQLQKQSPLEAMTDASLMVVNAAPAALGLHARITQAAMPNIFRNLFVMALPIPIPGVRGAGIDVALLRSGEAEPLASFQCDHQMGMMSFLDSYRRLAQAKTAMERCVDKFAWSVAEGRLVDGPPVASVADPATLTP